MPVWLLPLLLAPIVGSFLGVLVRRLPEGRPVALARSACDSCGTPLGARELVPLVSYLALRGRCRHCAAPIGRFHPAIELAAVLVAAIVVFAWSMGPPSLSLSDQGSAVWLWSGCVLGWITLALAWIDLRWMRLPDLLTLPLLLLGLLSCRLLDPDALPAHAAAAALGYSSFAALAWSYRRLRGRDGLGPGDAKLLAASGAWVGLAALPMLVLLAAVATLVVALPSRRARAQVPIPFGPGLAFSLFAVWLYAAPGR
ncbi:prepilin peptidase [Lichenicola sp.]|uniref:prepilin peptidase n=1 Tax=Lichenicola sp. TaxID=2804529 RepID=UPI003B0019FE